MKLTKSGLVTRRSLLKSTAATGAALTAGLPLFNINRAFADMPNPADVLAKINVGNMVKKEYREQYKLGDNDELWDPKKDWIRTVDWEAVRKEHAGKTVRFAIGAADRESAQEQTQPFADLSGIKIDLVAIPDDSMYDKVVAEFLSGNAGFDAIQFFSPWLGDFGAQGFLKPLDEYIAKWALPFDDFYETYQRNYGHWADKGVLGIPFDCDIQQVHIRPSIFKKIGIDADRVKSIPTYDDMIRLAPELNKAEKGVNAIGMMCGRGFWATYTWQHIAAQYGLQLFNENWEPTFNGDAGVRGLETIVALSKHAIEGVAAADWPTNRAAWLGGQVACNISWQDSGTQATRPDQSKIGDDVLTIYEPRVAGGTYAPPNIAGSTSCVAVTSPEPEAAFLMLAYLTTASIMAMNEANANGVAPGYRSVLTNEKLRAVSQPAKVWSEALDYAWCAPRLPSGFQIDQEIGFLINKVVVGEMQPKAALDEAAAKVKDIMTKNGFYAGKDPMNYAATEPGFWQGKGKTAPF
ncbi:MAG: extracellular solute-binding protein [Proteobacteria bacterium]|nr:extracellular solute-binding protein [Pseudomonadota bacterium]